MKAKTRQELGNYFEELSDKVSEINSNVEIFGTDKGAYILTPGGKKDLKNTLDSVYRILKRISNDVSISGECIISIHDNTEPDKGRASGRSKSRVEKKK